MTDVEAAISFFERAFGFTRKFVDPAGYGELDTGGTTLAFASHQLGAGNIPQGYIAVDNAPQPLGIEIVLVTDDVQLNHENALKAGANEVVPPEVKPWGQTVSYLQSPEGILLELCTPVTA